jgi:hypothetical protein
VKEGERNREIGKQTVKTAPWTRPCAFSVNVAAMQLDQIADDREP